MAKQQQEQVEKVHRINRSQAANRVVAELDGRTTLGELAKQADGLVVAAGAKTNVGSAKFDVRRALETAQMLGIVKLTRPTDTVVERIKAAK